MLLLQCRILIRLLRSNAGPGCYDFSVGTKLDYYGPTLDPDAMTSGKDPKLDYYIPTLDRDAMTSLKDTKLDYYVPIVDRDAMTSVKDPN